MNIYHFSRVALIVTLGLFSQWAIAGGSTGIASASLWGNPTQLAESPLLNKDFGSVTVGNSVNGSTETVTVIATPLPGGPGGGVINITDISIESAHPGDFQVTGGSCVNATGLTNGNTCTLNLRFSPVAAGARSGILKMTCRIVSTAIGPIGLVCDNTSHQAYNLSGNGILAAIAQAIPTLGREGITLLALLLFVASFLVLRRR